MVHTVHISDQCVWGTLIYIYILISYKILLHNQPQQVIKQIIDQLFTVPEEWRQNEGCNRHCTFACFANTLPINDLIATAESAESSSLKKAELRLKTAHYWVLRHRWNVLVQRQPEHFKDVKPGATLPTSIAAPGHEDPQRNHVKTMI